MKKNKKIETSKFILIFSDVLTVLVTCATLIVVAVMHDTAPLEYLIPAVFGLSGVSHGFYFWKAKAENLHKYGLDEKISGESSIDEYFNGGN